jgi:hypothetical protein
MGLIFEENQSISNATNSQSLSKKKTMNHEIDEIAVQELYLASINESKVYEKVKHIARLWETENYTKKWLNKRFTKLAKQAFYIYCQNYGKFPLEEVEINELSQRLQRYYTEIVPVIKIH